MPNIVATLAHTRHCLVASHHHILNHTLTPAPTRVPARADGNASIDAPDDIPIPGSPHLPTSAHVHCHSHGFALFCAHPTYYHNLVFCSPAPNLIKTLLHTTKLTASSFSPSISPPSFYSSIPPSCPPLLSLQRNNLNHKEDNGDIDIINYSTITTTKTAKTTAMTTISTTTTTTAQIMSFTFLVLNQNLIRLPFV